MACTDLESIPTVTITVGQQAEETWIRPKQLFSAFIIFNCTVDLVQM